MALTIKVPNLDGTEFTEAATAKIQQLIQNIALETEAEAKDNCPVDTGNLRASISAEVEESSASIGTNVEYAAYVELGTKKMAARPFLYPAFKAAIEKGKGALK